MGAILDFEFPAIFTAAILDFYLYFLWPPSWNFKFAAIFMGAILDFEFPFIFTAAILDFYSRHLGFLPIFFMAAILDF